MINAIVLLFGVLICMLAITGTLAPTRIRSLFQKWQGHSRFLSAVIMRLIFGALLIGSPDSFQFPTVMKVIGVISLAAGIVLLLMGQDRMDRLIEWWLEKPDTIFRVSFGFALVFGGFLIYSAS